MTDKRIEPKAYASSCSEESSKQKSTSKSSLFSSSEEKLAKVVKETKKRREEKLNPEVPHLGLDEKRIEDFQKFKRDEAKKKVVVVHPIRRDAVEKEHPIKKVVVEHPIRRDAAKKEKVRPVKKKAPHNISTSSSESYPSESSSSSSNGAKGILYQGVSVKVLRVPCACGAKWQTKYLKMEGKELVVYKNERNSMIKQGGEVIPIRGSMIRFEKVASKTHMIIKPRLKLKQTFMLPKSFTERIREQIESFDGPHSEQSTSL